MYTVVFVNTSDMSYITCGVSATLKGASDARMLADDVILDSSGAIALPIEDWLFPFEQDDSSCTPRKFLRRFGTEPLPLGKCLDSVIDPRDE